MLVLEIDRLLRKHHRRKNTPTSSSLDTYPNPTITNWIEVRDDVRRAKKVGYYPISINKLQYDNAELYATLGISEGIS